jgi:hypothetical protein
MRQQRNKLSRRKAFYTRYIFTTVMPLLNLAKILMLCGGALFLLGLSFFVGARLGLGQLPGDLTWRKGGTSISFPIVTCILLSIGLTILLNVVLRFFR